MNPRFQAKILASAILTLLILYPARAQNNDPVERCRRRLTMGMVQMAGHGEPQTDYCVGIAYDRGDMGFPQDKSRAVSLLKSSANGDYAPAQMVLGEHYAKGDGVAQDFKQAVSWWQKGAAQGFAGAQNDLGAAYMNGWGVPTDYAQAAKWFSLAAAQGDAKAQNNLASLKVLSTRRDRVEPAQDTFEQGRRSYQAGQKDLAAKQTLAAAQAGNSNAQVAMAWYYLNGVGVPKNAIEAAKWYRKAADQGNSSAMWNLGLLYERGDGVPEQWVEAARWYQKSAELNDAVGQRQLAFAYQYGIGVAQDRQTAIAWHRRAAASKDGQSAYWARWLSDPSNNIGFRNNDEHVMYVRSGLSLVYGDLTRGDPAGILFRNEAERLAWLENKGVQVEHGAAQNAARVGRAEYERKKETYRACMNAGGGNCLPPGPPPKAPQ
jgi:TPR repeat protein